MENFIGYVIGFLVILLPIAMILLGCFFTTGQNQVRFVERFGRFVRIGRAGLSFKIPFIESVSSEFSLQTQQLVIETETKTKDNVFVLLNIAVQYAALSDHDDLVNAYYKLSNPKSQLVSWVNDSIRGVVPSLQLDDAFSQKGDIAEAVRASIGDKLVEYGYRIERVLLTDIRPDAKVQEAMNEINAAQRLREAATSKAEADKIVLVKKAEAEKESKILQGEGVAGERKAIVEGLQQAITDMAKQTGLSEAEVMQYVQFTQYTDMMRDVGKQGTTIMMPMTAPEMLKSLIASKHA